MTDTKIELGKTYRTRDGREVRIYAVDGDGLYPIHGAYFEPSCGWVSAIWTKKGHQHCDECDAAADLIEVKPQITRTYWLAHYPEGVVAYTGDRKPVDTAAIAITGPHTITFTEGEGL